MGRLSTTAVSGDGLPDGKRKAARCTGEITDAQRNNILYHHSSSFFQKNYASRYMPDIQAAYLGLKPQTALMRAANGMSRTIDPRRPRKLNPA